MPPIHDSQISIGTIFGEVQSNLYEVNLKWFTSTDILNAIQDVYNKTVAVLQPIERSTFIPQVTSPYYDLADQIPNFMYVTGIFNPATNCWLEGLTYKQMKATYQTYLAIGQPKWVNIVDMRKIIVWPYSPGATGVLYVLYKASAPDISMAHIPILPHSVGSQILEYLAMQELMEQAREFKKASIWEAKVFDKDPKNNKPSLWDQAKLEIQNIARVDRENVLEPYRWIFHGGQYVAAQWINNEVPVGNIDGINATFTLAQVPSPTSSVLLILNGQVQFESLDYVLNGQTITYQSGKIPQTSGDSPDVHRVWYQVA